MNSRFMISTRQKISLILATIIFVPLNCFEYTSHAAAIKDPETELATVKTSLDNLLRRIQTSKETTIRLGLGPQTISAESAWAAALNFYSHREYRSTIRELNNYLNLTQVPQTASYLSAQYMLGRSYQALDEPRRALRAYFRYIAAFLTAQEQNQDELLDVLRRMIPLASLDDGASQQLDELLASLTSLEFPEAARPTVFYLAAKAAANSGKINIANTWLEKSKNGTKDSVLKQKVLYVQSLIAISDRNYPQAKELLSEVIQLAPKDTEGKGQYEKNLARLALARLAIQERQAETALKYYKMIPSNADSFKDGLFESIYIHLDLKQNQEARSKAMLYLARYPESSEALQLRMLLAYLDLRAGDSASASQSINATNQRLGSVTQWINQNLRSKSRVTQLDLKNFLARTEGLVPNAPSVDAAYRLFGRLAEAARQLADVRGEIRNLLYTVGRGSLGNLKPYWLNRAEQLAAIGDELLEAGHRLAAAERHLYKERLTSTEWQQLNASEARRTALLTPAADARRKLMRWASYANFADLTKDLAGQYRRLTTAEAELASTRYLLTTATNSEKQRDSREKRIRELESQVSHLSGGLGSLLEKLRSQKIETFLTQSPHRAARKFMSQYALALKDESETLAQIRQRPGGMSGRLIADDATKAWNTWDFAAQELFRQLDDLDKDIANGLNRLLADIADAESSHRRLNTKLNQAISAVESQVGISLAYIIDQYSGSIDKRMAQNRKWQADLDWMSYQAKADAGKKIESQFELERQILKDQLTDLQQGVLWKWPE